ncbi:MAG: PqqD family protein [Ignavibacteriae bacterium]|nr:PqqD family protein [Ignavibacteriota bacterium]
MDTAKYFYRNVIFSRTENKVSLIDIHNPDNEKQELEPWFGIVLQLADGQHTIEELFNLLSNKYKGAPPANLKETIHSVVERLAKANFIVLTEEKTELPYYLSMPYEHLDIEKAKKLLVEDRTQLVNEFKKGGLQQS